MLANGGKEIKPTLIKSIQKVDGTEVAKEEYESYFNTKLGIEEEASDEIRIDPENLKTVLEGMRDVTSESGGTAYKYFKDFNITVGGKTGTAQVEKNNEIVYAHAWFVGFAPFDNPEIAVVILVERGGSGSYTVEAARDVMAEYFGMNTNNVEENINAIPIIEIQN